MSKSAPPKPVLLFAAILYNREIIKNIPEKKIEGLFGEIDFMTAPYAFNEFSLYYNDEMGERLTKSLVFFKKLRPLNNLSELKTRSNKLEMELSAKCGYSDRRVINIDPGYLNLAKVVLFSTKDFAHRVYIQDGIFAEITLSYKKNRGFVPLAWTYPDYREKSTLDLFNDMRTRYKELSDKDSLSW